MDRGDTPSDELKEQRKLAAQARREEMRKRAFENVGEDPSDAVPTDAVPSTLPNVPATPVPPVLRDPEPQVAEKAEVPIRESMVKNAIEFLQEPRVAPSPEDRKRKFLLSRGLTEAEINEAFKRAAVSTPVPVPAQPPAPIYQQPQQPPQYQNAPILPPRPVAQPYMLQPMPNSELSLALLPYKSLAFVFIICAGIGSAVAWLVKKYVVPYFFGSKSRPSIKAKGKKTLKEVKKDVEDISKQVKAQESELQEAVKLIRAYLKQQAMLQGATIEKDDKTPATLSDDISSLNKLLTSNSNATSTTALTGFTQNFAALRNDVSTVRQTITGALNPSRNPPPFSYTPPSISSPSIPTLGLSPSIAQSTTPATSLSTSSSAIKKEVSISPEGSDNDEAPTKKPQQKVADPPNLGWLYSHSQKRVAASVPVDTPASNVEKQTANTTTTTTTTTTTSTQAKEEKVEQPVQTPSQPSNLGTSSPPPSDHPYSTPFLELAQRLQRNEQLPGIRDIDDSPLEPFEMTVSTPSGKRTTVKPWEKN